VQINFFLNGIHYKIITTLDIITLSNLLSYFTYDKKIFIIEYNFKICHQDLWTKQEIKNNDKIEIISIVGGG